MAMKTNPFSKFKPETKTAFITALDAEITYRMLTMDEADKFQARMVKGYTSDGEAELDYKALREMKYEKVAMVLVEPKMTVDELKALGVDAQPAITEINKLVSNKDADGDDETGN